MDAREQTMGDDDKELTEDEQKSLFPADFLDGLGRADCEPDAEALTKFDEFDAFDGFERFWSDEPARVTTSVSWHPASTIPTPAKPEMPSLEVATKPSDVGLSTDATDVFETVALRSTARKAKKNLPNCFGSQFLHDPESADCGPCKFSNNCKKAIADEMPLLEAARNARRLHFKPSGDTKQREFLRGLLRGHYLGKYRKARKKKRKKDKAYQQEKRANPDAKTLIEKEFQERLSALHHAIVHRRTDKYLQQLRGREAMIMAVWEAEKYAQLAHGPRSSSRLDHRDHHRLGAPGVSS